jgi:putative ABC transport system permease protein
MNDTMKCAIRELTRRRNRTIANIIGYTLAVTAMVVLVSVLFFSRDTAGQVLTSTGTHFIAFNSLTKCNKGQTGHCFENTKDSKREGFVANGVKTKMLSSVWIPDIKKLPAVKDASAYLSFRFMDPQDGHQFVVGGFDPQSKAVATTCCAESDIVEGRFLTANDKKMVMLEQAYSINKDKHANDIINIAGVPFTIIGVVNPGIRPAKADVYMHFDEAEKVISRRTVVPLKNEMNIVLVEVKSSKLQKEAMKEVQSVIPDLVISSYACWKPAATVMGMNEKSVWLLAILLCLATVSLALRSQWASVIERRRDIGIMKAIGWTNRVVVEQILTESMLQALIGGVAGCIIALLILLLIPAQYILGGTESMVVALSPLVFVSGLALSLLGGAIAGILPARYAANQSPADALRQL